MLKTNKHNCIMEDMEVGRDEEKGFFSRKINNFYVFYWESLWQPPTTKVLPTDINKTTCVLKNNKSWLT